MSSPSTKAKLIASRFCAELGKEFYLRASGAEWVREHLTPILDAFAAQEVKAERERCAQIAEDSYGWTDHPHTNDRCIHWKDGKEIAAAIRGES